MCICTVLAATVAIVQAIFSCYLLLMVSVIVFYLGDVVNSFNKYIYVADIVVGTNASENIAAVTDTLKYVVIGIFLSYFIICVLLCKGLCERKPWMIFVYIIYGGCLLGFRVWYLPFFDEDSVAHCGGYAAYLLLLLCIFADQLRAEKRKRKASARYSMVASNA